MSLPEELDFPTAVSLGMLRPDDDEWHRIRNEGVGGSEVSVIVGLNPWQSAYSLWHRKRDARASGSAVSGMRQNLAMQVGLYLEPFIADHYASLHRDVSVLEAPTYRHAERPWQVANPDRVLVHEDGTRSLLEVKTAAADAAVFWRDGPPDYYQCQVQWYMDVLGLERAVVAVMFGYRDYREFEVFYNEADAAVLRAAAAEFHASLGEGTQPALDGSESTLQTVRGLHEGAEDVSVDVPWDTAMRFATALAGVESAEEELRYVKSLLLEHIGSGRYAVCDGVLVATRAVNRETGRTHSLKADPLLLENFQVET